MSHLLDWYFGLQICMNCKFVTDTTNQMIYHKTTRHSKSKSDKKFHCTECGCRFFMKYQLDSHTKSHTEENRTHASFAGSQRSMKTFWINTSPRVWQSQHSKTEIGVDATVKTKLSTGHRWETVCMPVLLACSNAPVCSIDTWRRSMEFRSNTRTCGWARNQLFTHFSQKFRKKTRPNCEEDSGGRADIVYIFEFEHYRQNAWTSQPWLVFSLTYLYLPASALCSLPTANSIRPRLLCSNSRTTSWKLLTLEESQFWLLSTCPLHSILWTMPHFSTDFNILSVCPAMSSHGFDPTWLTAHPLLKSTRLPHPTQQYAQVYPRAPSLAHFFLFSLYHLSPMS